MIKTHPAGEAAEERKLGKLETTRLPTTGIRAAVWQGKALSQWEFYSGLSRGRMAARRYPHLPKRRSIYDHCQRGE